MKKTLVAITMAIALQATTSFAAALPSNLTGDLYAIKDTNIRSSARIARNIIGHLDANQEVKVISKLGTWCKISGTKYKNAYVVCNLLAKKTAPKVESTVIAPVTQSGTTEKTEQAVQPLQLSQSQNIITFVSPNETQETKRETQTQAITQETKVESQTQAVTQETKAESQTQAITQETKVESQTQAVTQETKTESQTQAVTQETKVESQTQAVTQETKTESQTQAVTQETKQETETQAVTQETKAESQTQAVTQETKQETETQPVTQETEALNLADTSKNITNTIKLDLQWLTKDDNSGRKIINSQYDYGYNWAKFWQKDAKLGEVKITFPAYNHVNYIFYFVSSKDKENYYKSINSPLDNTRILNYVTKQSEVPTKLNAIELPIVNYTGALQKILEDKKVITALDEKFKYSKQSDVFIELTLTGDKSGSSWLARFNDYNKEIESYLEINATNADKEIYMIP